jgi:uncharacterized protein (TIGR03067 family)
MQLLMREMEKAREEAANRDRERLQGGWRFVAGQREASLIVSGDQYTMRFRNGDHYEGTLTLDPTCRPRAMDLTIDDGPVEHRGKPVVAIYQFDGDHLIWCPAPPGDTRRPEAFPTTDNSQALCLIFRRAS